MNESEVEEHRIESGEEFLLITAKVIFFCRCESERGESESGRGKAKDRSWGKFSVDHSQGDLLCSCESEREVGVEKQRIEGVSVDHS